MKNYSGYLKLAQKCHSMLKTLVVSCHSKTAFHKVCLKIFYLSQILSQLHVILSYYLTCQPIEETTSQYPEEWKFLRESQSFLKGLIPTLIKKTGYSNFLSKKATQEDKHYPIIESHRDNLDKKLTALSEKSCSLPQQVVYPYLPYSYQQINTITQKYQEQNIVIQNLLLLIKRLNQRQPSPPTKPISPTPCPAPVPCPPPSDPIVIAPSDPIVIAPSGSPVPPMSPILPDCQCDCSFSVDLSELEKTVQRVVREHQETLAKIKDLSERSQFLKDLVIGK